MSAMKSGAESQHLESTIGIRQEKSVLNFLCSVFCFPCASMTPSQSGSQLKQVQVYVGNHLTRSWTKDDKLRSNKDDAVVNETGTPPPEQHYYFRIEEADATDCCSCLWFKRSSTINNNSFRHNNNHIPSLDSDKHLAILLSHKNVSPDDLCEWRNSFEALLANPAGQFMFKSFLASEVADENILFWLAVENLKKEKKTKGLQKRIQSVYDDFISVYSPHEINIDYKMREEIVANLNKEPDALIFRPAQMQIYHLMHRDSYPRFTSTVLTEKLEKELAKRTKKSGNKKKSTGKNKKSPTVCGTETPCAEYLSPQQPEHHKLDVIVENVEENDVAAKLSPPDVCSIEQTAIVEDKKALEKDNKLLTNDNAQLSHEGNIAKSP